jgi:ATP-dependent RNA helicase DeaD
MLIQSRTGSGKTGAYLLPILEMVNRQHTTQVLMLAPTIELALQITTEAEMPARNTNVRSARNLRQFLLAPES